MSATGSASQVHRFGDFELDLRSGELRNNGHKTRLPEQLFRILALLLERRGEVVTREELRQSLWAADTFVDFDTGLNTAISKLREVLGDSADHPKYIETLPRRGYRLVAPPEPAAEAATPRRALDRTWIWFAAFALGILTVVIGVRAWKGSHQTNSLPPRIESIAVLPLENLSGDPAQDYFADGMTDALITDLAQIEGLRVISRTSVMPYKNARRRLPEIARELNVDAIVEGTVMRSGSRVRITAQLIRASTDQHLWAKSYQRDVADALALQGELAQAIADAVEVKVAPQVRARLRSAPQLNPDAYEAFYRGLVALSQVKGEAVPRAIRHFERAVTIQPDFALAHVKLARSHYQYAFFGPGALPPSEFMPRAEAAARRALKADPAIAEAHTTLAHILYRYHWDWTNAEAEFRRALELSPNDAWARGSFAVFLTAIGRFDEAAAQKAIARKLDPKGPANQDDLSRARDSDRAIAAHRKNLQRNPSTRAYFQLGSALVMNGQLSEGIKALEASEPERNARYLAYLGYAHAAAGNEKRAREILQELTVRSRKQYVSSFAIALVHMGLGEKQAAIDRLERAYQDHAFELAHLNFTRAFDPLRADSRFQDLVTKLGLPARPDA